VLCYMRLEPFLPVAEKIVASRATGDGRPWEFPCPRERPEATQVLDPLGCYQKKS